MKNIGAATECVAVVLVGSVELVAESADYVTDASWARILSPYFVSLKSSADLLRSGVPAAGVSFPPRRRTAGPRCTGCAKGLQPSGQGARAAKGRLQIIVLDHAAEDVWGSLDGVELREEWRDGRALVPPEWFANQPTQ